MMNHLDCDQTKFDYKLSCSSVYRVNQNKLITILKVIDFAEVGKYCGSWIVDVVNKVTFIQFAILPYKASLISWT